MCCQWWDWDLRYLIPHPPRPAHLFLRKPAWCCLMPDYNPTWAKLSGDKPLLFAFPLLWACSGSSAMWGLHFQLSHGLWRRQWLCEGEEGRLLWLHSNWEQQKQHHPVWWPEYQDVSPRGWGRGIKIANKSQKGFWEGNKSARWGVLSPSPAIIKPAVGGSVTLLQTLGKKNSVASFISN